MNFSKDFLKKRTHVVMVAALVIFLILIGLLTLRKDQTKRQTGTQIPTEVVIPTVDSSVIVELKSLKKSVATLSVKNAPQGTKKIEYLVSYDAKPGPAFSEDASGMDVVPQGFQGTCHEASSVWECGNDEPLIPGKRIIVFGSSSSGVYRFHDIVGKVKVNLEFSGSYGMRTFEKEYGL